MSNDFWITLGIEPTKDEEIIRKAYLELLPNFHPEDDPEGFQRLRAAYESALSYTKESEEFANDDTSESGLIVRELTGILDDFVRRLNPDEWHAVLDGDECAAIDIQTQIGEKFLVKLMGNYYIPRKIWIILNDTFNWSEMADLLKEKFPPAYIDYVLNGIKYEEIVRCDFIDLSNPSADFLGFLDRYYSLNDALNSGDYDLAAQMISENNGPLFNHLDYRILLVYYYNNKEEKDNAESLANTLMQEYPDDSRVMHAFANVLLRNGKPEEAIPLFETVIEKNISHVNSSKVGIARCYFEMENYEKSKEICLEMLVDYYFDDYVSAIFHASSEKLIPIYEEKLKETPDDQDIIYKLASCYFNEYVYDKCLDLVKDVVPEEQYVAKHYEILFDALLETNDYSDGIPDDVMQYLYKWEETETNRKRLRYLPQKYLAIKMPDKALEKAEIYLLEFPGNPEICAVQGRVYREKGMYLEAHNAIEEGLKTEPSHPGLLSEQAHLFMEEGDIGNAVGSAERALSTFPYLLDMREMIIKAYYDARQYERAESLIQETESYNIESKDISMYKAAIMLSLEKDTATAAGILLELSKEDEDNLFILEKLGDYYTNEGIPDKGIEIYNRLIALSEHPYYYLSRGWIIAKNKNYFGENANNRAIQDYKRSVEIDPEYAPGYYQLGVMAYEDNELDSAIDYLKKSTELDAIRHAYIYLVRSYCAKGDLVSALNTADKAIEIYTNSESDEAVKSIVEEKIQAFFEFKLYGEAVSLEDQIKDEDGGLSGSYMYKIMAYCHYEMREDDIAESYYEKALQLSPNNDEILRSYAHFKVVGRKDFVSAIDLLQKALSIHQYYRTHVRIGKAYLQVGQVAIAKKHFKEALRILKDYLMTKNTPCMDYYIAECYFGLGKYRKAESYLLKSVNNSKNYSGCNTHFCYEAAFLLAEIYRYSKKKDIARKYFNAVIDAVPDREYAEKRPFYD